MLLRQYTLLILTLVLAGSFLTGCSSEPEKLQTSHSSPSDLISGKPQSLPIPNMVTMVDIGAHECIPCKMMTPIIEELSREYDGRAAIAFIDVWEHNAEAKKYGVQAIPTQIFYDANGVEQYRHVGFMDKATIVAKLSELGVQ